MPPEHDQSGPAGFAMRAQTGRRPGVLPLRPLTVGELLDAGVGLLRRHAAVLLLAGAVLAVAEQGVLWPVRQLAGSSAPWYWADGDRLGAYWLMIGAGLGTEAAAIALVGGLAARAAGPDLLGTRLPNRRLVALKGSRAGAVTVVAVLTAPVVAVSALALLVPWVIGYGLTGLAVPAVVIDGYGPGGALLRSIVLSARHAMRAMWVRVSGYLGWLAIRGTLAYGGAGVLFLFFGDAAWLPWAAVAIATAVNAVAYPTLACLDAVLHLETRIRTEALDIWLSRRPTAQLLRVKP